jgi:hypothetical protein
VLIDDLLMTFRTSFMHPFSRWVKKNDLLAEFLQGVSLFLLRIVNFQNLLHGVLVLMSNIFL